MEKFSEEEKEELRHAASSKELRDDMRHIRKDRHRFLKPDGTPDIEQTILFLADMNKLINHAPKPFKRITGNNFRM
jgi:hypothetical protein